MTSTDLSWADVTQGREVKQEVVVWERRLRAGCAAMVTWREETQKGILIKTQPFDQGNNDQGNCVF